MDRGRAAGRQKYSTIHRWIRITCLVWSPPCIVRSNDAQIRGYVADPISAIDRLDGNDGELKAQVGHKVEISGTIEPKPKPDAAPKSETERLHVSTIKMLATDCTK